MDVNRILAYYAKVKSQLSGDSVLWNEFQEIQKTFKIGRHPCEVLAKLSKLFHGFPDLLTEFEELLLPESYRHHLNTTHKLSGDSCPVYLAAVSTSDESPKSVSLPRIPDDSVSHVAVYGSYKELQFFDKVRKALGYEKVFENFLHCLELFNDDRITQFELVEATNPFLAKFPELQKQLKEMLFISESGEYLDSVPHKIAYRKKLDEEVAYDIDYWFGRHKSISYRPLPKSYVPPLCSGRTPLCKEVLNDYWVSVPAWVDDSDTEERRRGSSKTTKSDYETDMYHIEDERFELDMAIRTNAYAIDVLNNVQKRINKLTEEEKLEFTLDDTLGGTSSALMHRFIRRIYGDRTNELMEGLKRNPVVAVPIVLNRLRIREKEWKEVQEKYNALWREHTNRIYLKSLDHQGINFKQIDARNLRPKTLLNEIETHYEEQKQKIVEGSIGGTRGPHITCCYKELRVFKDALNFILHDIKRQPGICKDDRRQVADLLCFFVTGFFNMQTDLISSIEADKKSDQNCVIDVDSDGETNTANSPSVLKVEGSASDDDDDDDDINFLEKKSFLENVGENMYEEIGISADQVRILKIQECILPYSLFFVNNNWYIFFRLFSVLVVRLASLYVASSKIEAEEKNEKAASTSSQVEYTTPYSILLNKVYCLISGKIDSSKFEDEMRELFTIDAYVSYTLDKVVHAVVKQLHLISSDDVSKQCMTYYANHAISLHEVRNPWLLEEAENLYENKVVKTVGEENCYKIMWVKAKKLLAIELLDTAKELAQPVDVDMSDYLENYLNDDISDQEIPVPENSLPVIHARNLRKQRKLWAWKVKEHLQSDKGLYVSRGSGSIYFPNSRLKRKRKTVLKCNKKMRTSHAASFDSSPLAKEKNVKEVCSKGDQNENFSAGSNENLIECSEIVDLPQCSDFDNSVINSMSLPLDNLESVDVKGEKSFMTNQREIPVYGYDIGETEEGNVAETLNYEEDEDSINVSAEDLYFHLTQTMPIFDHFPSSLVASSDLPFYQKSYDSEFVIEDKRDDLNSPEMSSSSSKSGDENQYSEYCNELVQEVQLPVCSDKTFGEPLFIQSEKNITDFEYDQNEEHEIPQGVFQSSQLCSDSSAFTPSLHVKERFCNVIPDQELPTFQDKSLNERDSFKVESQTSEKVFCTGIKSPTGKQTNSDKDDDDASTKSSTSSLETSEKNDVADENVNLQTEFSDRSIVNDSDSDVSLIFDESREPTLRECLEMAMRDMEISDNSFFVFDEKTFKMQFTVLSHDFCYRKGSFLKARKVHRQVSARFNEKFSAWHRLWLEENVTTNMLKSCHDWLLRSDPDKFRVHCVTVNDQKKPPYGPYTKYCVRFYKRR